MKKALILTFTLACFLIANGQSYSKLIKTDIDSLSYSLGVEYAGFLTSSNINDLNIDVFSLAFKDVQNKKKETYISSEDAKEFINTYFTKLTNENTQENVKKGNSFLDENKKNEGVIELTSGLQYKVITTGTGSKPTASDEVLCHYKGTLIDGTVFDSSYDRGDPIEFPLNGVIPGWTEALQLMPTGSKWILFIPPHLAYGERGAGNSIGPNETLIFEVELLKIK